MDASPSLRSRKDLIVQFVDSVSVSGEIDAEWRTYVDAKRTAELEEIITSDRGRGEKKQRVLTRLGEFFERFFGLDSSTGRRIVPVPGEHSAGSRGCGLELRRRRRIGA